MQVFFYRPLGQAQFVSDLFVGFGLTDQRDNLLLAE
jgi:hypothetical protein